MTIPPTPQAERGARQLETAIQLGPVMVIVAGHFTHDLFTAFTAPLLPDLIEKFSLSLTMVGLLTALQQLPAIFNPFIGYLADRISLRYFVIFAPAASATFISLLGIAPTPGVVALLMILTGVSIAAFHAPAPPMVARVSGNQLGRGMSYFMAGGELARTAGPLLLVWVVSLWGLEGYWPVMILGWMMSGLLYWRLHRVPARPESQTNLREMLPAMRRLFLPLFIFIFLRTFAIVSLATFLPTFMSSEGASRLVASGALSIYEFAGVGGALVIGPLSDRLGRRPLLIAMTVLASIFMLLFLTNTGWLQLALLLAVGFSMLSVTPMLLATVQETMPDNRAVANGIFLMLVFLSQPIAAVLIGRVGDLAGLRMAFTASAFLPLLAIPAILMLPVGQKQQPVG